MEIALIIIGTIAIIISVIAGLFTGTFLGFLIWLVGGVSIGAILFAFTQMITNQLNILYQLEIHNEFIRQLHKKIITCPNCNYEFDDAYSSCPRCGNRKLR